MEHWATQSLSIYDSWVLDMPLEFRLRVLPDPTAAQIMKCELLPGGRWLLTSNSQNQYFPYDLHLPSPRPQEIANPGQYDHEDGTLDEFTYLRL